MRTILAIGRKDLRLLLRDSSGLFFTFFFPLVYALFFGSIFSGGGSGDGSRALPLRLVDLDGSPEAAAFLEGLAARDEIDARPDSLASAEAAVRRGRAAVAVVVEEGFGEARRRLFWGDPPTVRLLRDPSRGAEAGLLQGVLFEEAVKALQERFQRPGSFLPDIDAWLDSLALPTAPDAELDHLRHWLNELRVFLAAETRRDSLRRLEAVIDSATAEPEGGFEGFTPLRVKSVELRAERIGPRSYFEISFPQGLIWGVIAVAASFAVSLVVERREGTLRRLRAAPVTRGQILAGKALACFGLVVVLCLGLFIVGWFFGVRPAAPLLLAAAVLATATAFTGLMMLISVLGRTERAVGGIGWALMMAFAMVGGGMVPLFFMPGWMQTLGHASPVKWSILAMEGALWRGFSPAEMLLPVGVLVAVGLTCFAIGVAAFRWSE
jgi:ABC-2 type transport system permease protein